jgi:arylsulfatase A-like enzyme
LIRGSKKGVAEGGIRVPAVLEWPAMIKEPRVVSVPISGLDFYPTFAAMLGVTPKAVGPLDGEDVMPILKGEAGDRRSALRFYVSETYPGEEVQKPKPPASALVEKRFKLSNTQGKFVLYDLPADPMETTNVADQHPGVYQRMQAELAAFHESLARCARRISE